MAAIDLTTRAAVRTFLQKPAADTNQDALIDTLITAASRAIGNYAQREFVPTASATRQFLLRGGYTLDLAPYDLRTVTTITLDPDLPVAEQTTLTTADYKLRPKPAVDGTYQQIRLNVTPRDTPGKPSDREVAISGAWGFAAIPEDVSDACIKTVAIWLRGEVQAFATTFSLDEQRLERPEALPSAVRGALRHYRPIPVA